MFGHRYFGARYFAPRYFGPSDQVVLGGAGLMGYHTRRRRR